MHKLHCSVLSKSHTDNIDSLVLLDCKNTIEIYIYIAEMLAKVKSSNSNGIYRHCNPELILKYG
jgi:hypothetical protein